MDARNLSKEARNKNLKAILSSLSPVIKKHGKENVRWALNRWTRTEQLKNSLLKKKKEIEKELLNLS